jgi:hypothetical protein
MMVYHFLGMDAKLIFKLINLEEPVGFEPTRRLRACFLSKEVRSTGLCHGSLVLADTPRFELGKPCGLTR